MAAVKKPKAPKTSGSASGSVSNIKKLPAPIVVVHGNPASNMFDHYPTVPEDVFTLSRGGWPMHVPGTTREFARLPFHPDDERVTLNTTGKVTLPARVLPNHPFYLPYQDLVEQLKTDVGWQDQPALVFPFAYDWRFDSSVSAGQLNVFITEVLDIVRRLPDYKDQAPAAVDIVAHSYGGLVTARYLLACQLASKPARVRKVVTIAAPFQGALDALHAMTLDKAQRETARTLPSVWGLLPTFDGAVLSGTTDVKLLTDPSLWKGSSIERSLALYCQRMGSQKSGLGRLEELRAAARAQAQDFSALDVGAVLPSPDNWMPIVGVNSKTNVRARITPTNAGPEFAFETSNSGEDTGDNTVPFAGAVPPFNLVTGLGSTPTPKTRLVCFTEEDIGLHERANWLGLGQLLNLASLHSFMPSMDAVQGAIIGFLRETPPSFKAKARPAPNVQTTGVTWPASWNLIPVS